MSAPLPQRVLILENSRSYASMLAEAMEQRLGLPVALARTLAEADAALASNPDIVLVLSGLVLPDATQDAIIERLAQTGLPVVVVSSTYDEALRERILGRSVIDYVIKSAPGHLDYLAWLAQRLDRNRRIAALVVDDSPSARLMAAELLSSYGFHVLLATSGEHGLRAVEQDHGIRLVITDHEMPGMTGVELSAKLRERYPRDRLAIIGVSGANKPELVARFLKNGANDFLHKPFSREEFFCRVSQNIDNLDLIGTLQDLATKDFLTGLSNRRHFFELAERRLEGYRQAGRQAAVATLDIDHYKKINDTWGHDGGDLALKAVARVLQSHMRQEDICARFGGEEFVVLAGGLDTDASRAYFEALRERIAAIDVELPDDRRFGLTTSIGVRLIPAGEVVALHAALNDSDRQLYLAKAGGRNRVDITATTAA
ncbi:MAG: diguanylate cyclase [Lysobacteraceae bacterium]